MLIQCYRVSSFNKKVTSKRWRLRFCSQVARKIMSLLEAIWLFPRFGPTNQSRQITGDAGGIQGTRIFGTLMDRWQLSSGRESQSAGQINHGAKTKEATSLAANRRSLGKVQQQAAAGRARGAAGGL